MTNRKFVDHWRRATARKASPRTPLNGLPLDDVQLPEEKLTTCSLDFDEQLSRLMVILPDDLHRQIAVLKLAEYTSTEIGDEVQRAVPTVNRKWCNIRRIWADELEK